MSWSVDLFVNLAPSIDVLAQEVDIILNINLKRVEDDTGVRYEYFNSDFIFTIYPKHEFENDRDMIFEAYRFQLNLHRQSTKNPDQSRERALHAARAVYNEFKQSGRYQLMLVEDVQKKLDSFDPKDVVPEPQRDR